MKNTLKCLLVTALFAASAGQPAIADDDDHDDYRDRIKVRGSYHAAFLRFDFFADNNGSPMFDVALQGPFTLKAGRTELNGIVRFPHILQFPADPTMDGSLVGAAAWLFDDGLSCLGNLSAPIGADGFRGRGRFACSDGSTLVLKVRDEVVVPGESVTASLKGRFLVEDDD